MLESNQKLHVFFILKKFSLKTLYYPTYTCLDPYYLLKLVRLPQRRKQLPKKTSPDKNSLNC